MGNLKQVSLIIICFYFLTACATFFSSSSRSLPPHSQPPTAITQWTLRGAIAVRLPKQAWSAYANWQQTRAGYELRLLGPIAADSVVLTGGAKGVTMRMANGEVITAKSPEILFQRRFGWVIPISNLYYWVRGLPAPGKTISKRYDSSQRLTHLEQQGWKITYSRYNTFQGIVLPEKLVLTNTAHQITVRLVINRWEFAK